MDPMELKYDKLLRIRTNGRDASHSDQYRYPYEPTPYCVLERIASTGLISRENTLLDYGCGKGRVDFYLSSKTGCTSFGVDFDSRMIEACEENRKECPAGKRTSFICEDAGIYRVPRSVDRCWFFNPFSAEVLERVLWRLNSSLQGNPRELLMFFYFPEEETLSLLNASEGLTCLKSIDCQDLFPGGSKREQILIYRVEI